MIYTLTLNPAIDYVIRVPGLRVGSIHRCERESVFFGGKGINVSTVLRELGVPSTALGFLAGFTGQAISQGLSAKGIANDFVFSENGFSRINVKIRAGEETDLNGRGPDISKADLGRLYEKLEALRDGDTLVLAGSIPPSLPSDIYQRIMGHLSQVNVRFVVDAAGELLVNTLRYCPFLIKPNLEELGEIFSVTLHTAEQAHPYALQLQQRGARNVLVSMGEKGAFLLDETGMTHFCAPYAGTVVNTVGAGDSMVAGFLAGYAQTGEYAYALRLGSASGSATAFSEGLASRHEIASLMERA